MARWLIAGGIATLAMIGVWTVVNVIADWAVRVRYWLRDRVTPLLEDDRIVAGKCETCWAENDGEGCDWAMCGCACHDEEDEEELPPLPPERSWKQMTGHQAPVVYDTQRPDFWTPQNQALLRPERERRPPAYETEARAHYVAMGFDYPSGLMARVRELTP